MSPHRWGRQGVSSHTKAQRAKGQMHKDLIGVLWVKEHQSR